MLHTDARGQNFQLFEEFTAIKRKYHTLNDQRKDSLKNILYKFNEDGALDQAKEVNQQLSSLWIGDIHQYILKEEIAFLKKNINTKMFPYVYYSLVSTKEDFENYKEIYNVLPSSLKQTFDNHFSKLR